MKQWIKYSICVAIIILVGTSEPQGTDISVLIPVETVWVGIEGNEIRLETDTGEVGRGTTVATALENLKSKAAGNIFLDAADYLIVEKGREDLLRAFCTILRPSCMVCAADKMPDLKAAARFMQVHEPAITLRQWENDGTQLRMLREVEEGFMWHEQ